MPTLSVRTIVLGLLSLTCSAACAANSTATVSGSPDGGEEDSSDARIDGLNDSGHDAVDAQGAEAGDSTPEATMSDAKVEPVGCVTEVNEGHHRFSCNGIDYDVEVPPSCISGGCGFIVDLHGMTMNADQQDKNTGLRALGIQHGYVVMQPTAPTSAMGPSWTPLLDDEKVWAVMQDARSAFAIDPKRIHVAGFSQGGAMTWRMVCKHADVIASAAPVAGADASSWTVMPPYVLDCPFTLSSSPPAQIAILQMHGTADSVVPFAKGTAQRDALIKAWEMAEQSVVSTDTHHDWKRYVNAQGTIFEFVQHDYMATTAKVAVVFGGHCIPGSVDVNTNPSQGETMFFGCAPPNAFTWGESIMKFFMDHPKP